MTSILAPVRSTGKINRPHWVAGANSPRGRAGGRRGRAGGRRGRAGGRRGRAGRGGFLRVLVVIALAILLGVGGAIADYWRAFGNVNENFMIYQSVSVMDDPIGGKREEEITNKVLTRFPIAEVIGSDTYDFGIAETGAELTHTFQIKNSGNEPLEMRLQGVTCKCLTSGLDKDKVALVQPGETYDVSLQWRSDKPSPMFQQYARLKTNDPHERRNLIELKITGKVDSTVKALPTSIAIENASPTEETPFSFNVYAFGLGRIDPQKMDVIEVRCDNPELQDKLKFDWRRLTAEELAKEDESIAGFAVMGTVPAGMPMNNFQGQFITTVSDGSESAELVVDGFIGIKSPIQISALLAGQPNIRFYEEARVIDFGLVDPRAAPSIELLCFYRLKDENLEVRLADTPVQPDGFLKAEVVSVKKTGAGTVARLKISIPEDCPAAQLNGPKRDNMAKLTLLTNSKVTPELNLYISFSKR